MSNIRLPIALQQSVMRRLRSDLSFANKNLKTFYLEPTVTYRQRGTVAGTAILNSWEIRLNPTLLAENGSKFIDEVIPHELAHLLVFRQHRRAAPHGNEWQHMMRNILGVEPKRTHSFNLDTVQGQTWLYKCHCQQHQLTVRRHNRIAQGNCEYHCKKCGFVLALI